METYDYYCNACEKTTPHKLNGDCLECILKYVPPIATGNTYTQPPKENSAHSFTEGADVPESVPSCGDGWISVKDKMPDYDGDYLCFIVRHNECGTHSKYQRVINNHFNKWRVSDELERVTHWKQLGPEPQRSVFLQE